MPSSPSKKKTTLAIPISPENRSFFYRFRKLRMYGAWFFVSVLAIFARSTNLGFFIATPFIVLGEAIRIWSHGYLRKSRELATSGPYAYVRNPLYVGNFLIGFGFCLVIFHPVVLSVFVAGFFLVYWVTVKGEEERLALKFKEAYEHYTNQVPRFIPRLRPYQGRQEKAFQLHRVWGHGEYITILAIMGLFLVLYLRQEFYQNHNPLTMMFVMGVISAAGIGLLLLLAIGFRYFKFQ